MHDVRDDAEVPVRSEPPRRLSGLGGFFERHQVGVNDRLVLRFDVDATVHVQVEAVARRAPQRERGARDADEPHDVRAAAAGAGGLASDADPGAVAPGGPRDVAMVGPSGPERSADVPADKRIAAAPAQSEVVDRFGRVTVRRLGSGRGDRAVPPPSVPARVPAPQRQTPAAPHPDIRREASREVTATPPEVRREVGQEAHLATARPEAAAPAPRPAARDHASDARPTEARPLFAPAAPEPRAAEPSPLEPDRAGAAPAEATAADLAAGEPAAPEPVAPEPAGAPAPSAPGRQPPSPITEAEARRVRLNERGDLRTQVVRFLLRPDTPVILRVDAVAEHFDLDRGVAQEVMRGIQEDPPPSLAVEAVREDMFRIARVTVEQD